MNCSPWMTRQEVGAHLRVSVKTVDRYVREGKLTRHHLGGGTAVRFQRAEVEGLLAPAGNLPAA